jgi:hypothetical protein
MRPELIASGLLIVGGVALVVFGHFLGGAAALAVGAIAGLVSLKRT